MDGFFDISVLNGFKQAANQHGHSEFLLQFPNQTLLEALARFAFAAGKFPQPAQVGIGVALGDKKLAGAKEKTGADLDDGASARHGVTRLSTLDFRLPFHRPTLL